MKRIWVLLLILFSLFTFTGCKNDDSPTETSSPTIEPTIEPTKETPTPTETNSDEDGLDKGVNSKYLEGEYKLAKNIQDGVILHAWNWRYKTIKENLPDIARAGFSTVQTSPIVDTKAGSSTRGWSNVWAMLYQPSSLKIASNGALGTKEELKDLCAEAQKYGIKIICDMVLNHMGNNSNGTEDAVTIQDYLYQKVKELEPEIYKNANSYFKPKGGTLNTNMWFNNDLPDLNTANSYIQSRVIELLCDSVDCGVSGFRFDAAKHIETPDDKEGASNFWSEVLTKTSKYAKETYSKDIYYYGEILNGPENGRSITNYTKWMSVTDNGQSGNITSAIIQKNDTSLNAALNYSVYTDKIPANKAVLWVESHDNFAHGDTDSLTKGAINKAWSIIASRTAATSLYLARPEEKTQFGLCENYDWASVEVSAVNTFHNAFIGGIEDFKVQNGYSVKEVYREEDNKAGVIITNVKNSSNSASLNVTVSHMADGQYYDLVSGNEFLVTNGQVSGKMGSTGVVVLYKKTYTKISVRPVISASYSSNYLYEDGRVKATFKAENATKLSYKLDDGEYIDVTEIKGKAITLKLTIENATTVTIKAEGDVTVLASYNFYSAGQKREGYYGVFGIDEDVLTNNTIYAWVWSSSDSTYKSNWTEVEIIDGAVYVKAGDFDSFLLANFEKGYKVKNQYSWDDAKINQTDDYAKASLTIAYKGVL